MKNIKLQKLFLFFTLFIFIGTFSFCNLDIGKSAGKSVHKKIDISSFDALEINDFFDIEINQMDKESLELVGDEGQIRSVEAMVNNKTLVIKYKGDILPSAFKKVKLFLSYSNLKSINISGAAHLVTKTTHRSKNLEINISGAASLKMDIFAETIAINESGAGEFELNGKCDNLSIEISGAGSVNAIGLIAKSSTIEVSGAGSVRTNTSDNLDVNINGVGSVTYKGHPSIKKEISGVGSLSSDN